MTAYLIDDADFPSEAAPPDSLPGNANDLLLAGGHGPLACSMPGKSVCLADVVQGLQAKENGVRNRAHPRETHVWLELRPEGRARERWREGKHPLMCRKRARRRREKWDKGAMVLKSLFV